jgi:FxLD family lantipeptide
MWTTRRTVAAVAETQPDAIDPDLFRAVARSMPPQNITGAASEQVDLVVALGALTRVVIEHNRQVMAREPASWVALGTLLITAGGLAWIRPSMVLARAPSRSTPDGCGHTCEISACHSQK